MTHLAAPPAALTDHISQPVAIAVGLVVAGLVALILVVWLAKRLVHRILGIAVSVIIGLVTHSGTQTWIQHLAGRQ